MNSCDYNGKMGERIIATLFPHFQFSSPTQDQAGIDGFLGGLSVQIKADDGIAIWRNLYHEYWERTHEGQPWRKSPSCADLFFFVTAGLYVQLPAHELCLLEVGLPMVRIKPRGRDTSIGLLIALSRVPHTWVHSHTLWEPFADPPASRPPRTITDLSFDELDGCEKPGAVLG